MSTVLDELEWRGLIAQSTDRDELRSALQDGCVTAYCGFDPTAPSLHVGNLVQLLVLRHLQRAGHRVIVLVGGSTGLIGDPRPTAERVLKSKEETAEWVARIAEQVKPFVSFTGHNPAILVNNLDWTAQLTALDFLRDIGKHFRVNQMIRKDAVAARLASAEGISYTEFSYQLLQALDYLALHREHRCTLQTGGQDQWGNLTAGVDLVRRVEGVSVHAFTTPLILDSAGNKFGKSEGNAMWLSAQDTTPYAFYQFWFNVEDAAVIDLLKVFTDLDADSIAQLQDALAARPGAREAQRALAESVTTLVHGARAAGQVKAASLALFGRADLADLDPDVLAAALAEVPTARLTEVGRPVVELLVDTGLETGRGAARRTIAAGGAYLNNVRVRDDAALLTQQDLLAGRFALLRRGKRSLGAVVVEPI